MNAPHTTTAAHADTRPSGARAAPVSRPPRGRALKARGYYVGRVERSLYWVTGGSYRSAFLVIPIRTSSITARTGGSNEHR